MMKKLISSVAILFGLSTVTVADVKIGNPMARTGPIPELVKPMSAAVDLAVEHVNDQGGLFSDGQKYIAVKVDSACDPVAAVDAVTLAVSNAAKTLTVASGATVVIATDQAGTTTIDGPDAGATSNSVTISMNDGNTAANDTPDVTGGLTITDFKTATIDASVESTTVAGATLNDTTFAAINGSSDNTNLTIKGGSNTMTLSGTHTVGTGSFTIESNAAVALGASDITAAAFTHTGSGAVTWTDLNSSEVKTVTTGSGADAVTAAVLTEDLTLNTGAGADTITIATNTSASKTYSITGGDGADILSISARYFDCLLNRLFLIKFKSMFSSK